MRAPLPGRTHQERVFWGVVVVVLLVGVAGFASAAFERDDGDEGDEGGNESAQTVSLVEAAAASSDHPVWDDLAHCESRGQWSINTGNGFSGGLQFVTATWLANGGGEFAPEPHLATREEQIIVARRLLRAAGDFSHWPDCAQQLRLT